MICMTTEQRAALLALADARQGRVTPYDIVDAARDPDSPLHSAFTWDDAEAAHQHRLDQARYLIRRIHVDITVGNRLIRIPAFVRDPAMDVRVPGYVHLSRLRSDEENARDAVLAAFARAARSLQHARDLATVLGIERDVDELLVSIAEVRTRVGATETRV
jgi:hypothetical protein